MVSTPTNGVSSPRGADGRALSVRPPEAPRGPADLPGRAVGSVMVRSCGFRRADS